MKKNKEYFEVLCIVANAETEHYKQEYDRLKAEKNSVIKAVKGNYFPNTPLYKAELEKAEKDFQTKVSELKAEYISCIGQAIDNVRESELARVQTVNETRLTKIKAIADIPMTSEELLAIAERYDTTDDYWSNRLLCNIAEKNGVDNFEQYTEASYSLKTDILNQLADQAAEMVRDYDGSDQKDATARQRTMYVLLSKPVIDRCRELWNGENNFISDEQAIEKAYLTVYSKRTDIEKGLAMANILKNAKGERRNLLLCQFAEDTSISEFAFKLSGYGTELTDFRNGKAIEYKKARAIVEEMASIKDKVKLSEIVADNADNSFLDGLIKSESRRNTIFNELVGECTSNDTEE